MKYVGSIIAQKATNNIQKICLLKFSNPTSECKVIKSV